VSIAVVWLCLLFMFPGHISGHWDPAALARWNAVIPTCRLVCRAGRPCAEITMEFGTRADAPAGKKVRVSSLE